jgi:hypothetical protein
MTELNECIPLNRLELLNKMELDHYLQFANKTKYKMNEIKEHFNQIKSYIQLHIKCKGQMKKIYKHSEASQNGRLYGVNSIQNLDGIIRGFLFGTTTTDFDMKNAHPTILDYLCRLKNIRSPCLAEYIRNRETILHNLKQSSIHDPKMEILKMLNTEKSVRITNDYDNILKNLRDEFKSIRTKFKQDPEFGEQLKQAMLHKPNNIEGSFVNRILCIYENKMMNTMAEFIRSKNIDIAEYAFDGLLAYGDFYNQPEFLKEMEDYLNAEFPDLNMTLTMKPHRKVITEEFLESLDEPEEIDKAHNYDDMKKEFEKNHFKIINKSIFIHEYNGCPAFMKKQQLIDAYEHIQYKKKVEKGKIQQYCFILEWLKDENIKTYDDVNTYPPPLVCPNNIYNLWSSFAMETITDWEEMDISIFLNHFKIMCNHEEETFDYLIKWVAQMIQYPSVKTTMLFFQGAEGCGKGMMFKIIELMLGKSKFLETTSPERDVWGQFNPLMASSFFVYLNELSKKQTIDAEHKVKALITDNNIQINIKGKDGFNTQSYHRFGGSSNDDEPMNTHKGDRRKVLVSASNELKGNIPYFNELNKCVNDVNYIKSFYEYLKAIPDMDKFNLIPLPMTEYQKILCDLNISPIEAFVKDMVMDCEDEELVFTTKDLFEKYSEYLCESKTKYEMNIIQFGVRLSNLKLNGVKTIKGGNCNKRRFDVPILKKHFGIGCLIDPLD